MEEQCHEETLQLARLDSNEGEKMEWQFLLRAVLFWDFLNGDAYLVAQVPPGVHHAIRAFTQNHLVAILIGLMDVLMETQEMSFLVENLSKCSTAVDRATLERPHSIHCEHL